MAKPPEDWRSLLGRKVSVRYVLQDADHPFSEAVGVVMEVRDHDDGSRIALMTRRGERIELEKNDIVAANVFPI